MVAAKSKWLRNFALLILVLSALVFGTRGCLEFNALSAEESRRMAQVWQSAPLYHVVRVDTTTAPFAMILHFAGTDSVLIGRPRYYDQTEKLRRQVAGMKVVRGDAVNVGGYNAAAIRYFKFYDYMGQELYWDYQATVHTGIYFLSACIP